MKRIFENRSAWTKIETKDDISRLMNEFGGFCGSCCTDIDFIEGKDVNVRGIDGGTESEYIGAGLYAVFDRPVDLEKEPAPAVQMIEVAYCKVTMMSFCPDGKLGMQRYRGAKIAKKECGLVFEAKADSEDPDDPAGDNALSVTCQSIYWRKINYSL